MVSVTFGLLRYVLLVYLISNVYRTLSLSFDSFVIIVLLRIHFETEAAAKALAFNTKCGLFITFGV